MLILLVLLLFVFRFYTILPSRVRYPPRRSQKDTCTVAVFLGSGGHTSEALALLSALDFRRYNRRIYLTSAGDTLSGEKADALERKIGGGSAPDVTSTYSIITIPRARRVHQGLLSTPLSASWSLLCCLFELTSRPYYRPFADVLILNGPGTCFILCLAIYILRFMGLPTPIILYVETFARVKSLSLSGRLSRHLADKFITQWPVSRHGNVRECHWLV